MMPGELIKARKDVHIDTAPMLAAVNKVLGTFSAAVPTSQTDQPDEKSV